MTQTLRSQEPDGHRAIVAYVRGPLVKVGTSEVTHARHCRSVSCLSRFDNALIHVNLEDVSAFGVIGVACATDRGLANGTGE